MTENLDPFVVEVIRHGLSAAAEEMSLVMTRSARSPLLREAGDLSSAIMDAEGGLVGQGRDIPVHLGAMAYTIRELLKVYPAGRFREDLYYRLYVVPPELPPLRARGEDVPQVARHLLGLYAREEGKGFTGFDAEAEAAIRAYPWPGNVRQLQNVLRNAVVLHDGPLVTREMLPAMLLHEPAAEPAPATPARISLEALSTRIEPLAVSEKRLILQALEHTGQDVPKAAALLEINPSTIYRKLAAWKQAG